MRDKHPELSCTRFDRGQAFVIISTSSYQHQTLVDTSTPRLSMFIYRFTSLNPILEQYYLGLKFLPVCPYILKYCF